VTDPANASFEDVTHTEFTGGLPYVNGFRLVKPVVRAITKLSALRERSVVKSPVTASAKILLLRVDG
jgi:hypothetical protein